MKKLILLAMSLLLVTGCAASLQSRCNEAWGKLDDGRAAVTTLPASQEQIRADLTKSLDDAEAELRAKCGAR